MVARGAYGKDSSASGFDLIAGAGFGAVDAAPFRSDLRAVQARGLKAFVWLGAWLKQQCRFEHDDAWIRARLQEIGGHPAILAYFLGDEPLYGPCPNGPQLFRARTDLVRSLDPGHPTFTVIQAYEPGEEFPYAHWVGSTDILALDVYPCVTGRPCDMGRIDAAIAAAERKGVHRYWAVIQDFRDSYYRLPTPDELMQQYRHWQRSRMEGYLVFSWNYKGYSLEANPENVRTLQALNALPLH